MAHVELSLAREADRKCRKNLTHFKFSNRSKTTRFPISQIIRFTEKGRFACRYRFHPSREFLLTLPCRPACTRHTRFPPHGRKPRNPTEIRAQDCRFFVNSQAIHAVVCCVVCLCACGVLCVWQGRAGQEKEERRGKKQNIRKNDKHGEYNWLKI